MKSVTPYQSTDSKKEQVARMFDNIAFRYDFLNSLLSLGIHKRWRKRCVNLLKNYHPESILDVATGTADLAIACAALNPQKIIGVDISEGMLKLGREKIKKAKLDELIHLKYGDAETLDIEGDSFDAIVVAFGVRNFENLEVGLKNLHRILKKGKPMIILEFSNPKSKLIKALYYFYFGKITPFIGKLFSGDARAYTYLPESVKAFPYNEQMVDILKAQGFSEASYKSLSMGISTLYLAIK